MRSLGNYLESLIDLVTSEQIFPDIKVIQGPSTKPRVKIDGREVLLFCSPNYLGLSNHSKLKRAAHRAINDYGVGTNGSAIISGCITLYRDVECAIAGLMQTEAAIFFNSVTLANMGVISSIVDPPLRALVTGLVAGRIGRSAIFCDSENHASIIDAIRLAKHEKTFFYRHCDTEHLEFLLQRADGFDQKLIVTDGYFSMSADVAPLGAITELAERYSALVMVDDAHGTGVFGDNGRGTPEKLGVENKIDFHIGSLAKALGVRGGFVCGDRRFIDYLRVSARGYVFSGTLPPSVPGAVLKAIDLVRNDGVMRARLLKNAKYLRDHLKALGYRILGEGHILPVFIGSEEKAIAVARDLFEMGIFAPCVRFPAVPKGQASIRLMMMASHTRRHMEEVIHAFDILAQRHHLIAA